MSDTIVRPHETITHSSDVWDMGDTEDQTVEPSRDSFFGAINSVLRHRWWIVLGALLFAGTTVANKMTSPRTFTASSRFVSESGRVRATDLSGLAAQFGITIGGDGSSYGPQFYVDLVTSPVVLRQAVDHTYTFATSSGQRRANLIQYYQTHAETPERSRELAVRELAGNLRSSLNPKTGVVELSITSGNPDLSAQINQKLLDLLDRFNTETRRSRAMAERRFIEERLKVVGSERREAEARVEQFLRRNRQYQNSPELRFEYDRLNTDGILMSQVYTSLAQALEQAKIDEIRNTPVLTVVQPPVPPRWPNARGTLRAGLLALLLGGLVGLALGFLHDQWRLQVIAGSQESQEYRRLIRETLFDIRAVLTLNLWPRRPVR